MRILLVQRFDIQNVSCARRAVSFARELDRMGHSVTLVNFPHAERRQNLPQTAPELPSNVEVLELDRSGRSILKNLRILKRRAREFDIIHLWKSYPDAAIPTLAAALKSQVPIHYDWDDWETDITRELTGSRAASRLIHRWERTVLKFADTLSVASKALREAALEWGFPEDRIWDAPVGADLDRFRPGDKGDKEECKDLAEKIWPNEPFPDSQRPVLIYVGQIEVANLAAQCLEVLARLKHRRAKLLIVGGGRGLESLKNQARSTGLQDRVTFTDYVEADAVPLYLQLADLSLAPFEDTMVMRCKSPLKVAESLASGVPVVAGDVGEVGGMVGGCGRVVTPGDLDAMTHAMDELLDSPEKWLKASRAARKRAEEVYNWPRITQSLVRAYECAIQ